MKCLFQRCQRCMQHHGVFTKLFLLKRAESEISVPREVPILSFVLLPSSLSSPVLVSNNRLPALVAMVSLSPSFLPVLAQVSYRLLRTTLQLETATYLSLHLLAALLALLISAQAASNPLFTSLYVTMKRFCSSRLTSCTFSSIPASSLFKHVMTCPKSSTGRPS